MLTIGNVVLIDERTLLDKDGKSSRTDGFVRIAWKREIMIDKKRIQIKVGRLEHQVKTCHPGSLAYFIDRLKEARKELKKLEELEERDG